MRDFIDVLIKCITNPKIDILFNFPETLASFLALNPLDHHTGLLYSESLPIESSESDSEDRNVNIDLYKLVYNFDGHSLQNAIAEIIDDNRHLQGCFFIAPAERIADPKQSHLKAKESSETILKNVMTSSIRLFPSRLKELQRSLVAVILLRGAQESTTPQGELLAIEIHGFACPEDILGTAKRIDSVDSDITALPSPPASPRSARGTHASSSDVVVVLDDSDDESAAAAAATSKDAVAGEQAPPDSAACRPGPNQPDATGSSPNAIGNDTAAGVGDARGSACAARRRVRRAARLERRRARSR